MAGTKAGAAKARQTNLKRYGADFYAKIGAKGGMNGNTGGFFADRELARKAGKIGGQRSKRGPAVKPVADDSQNDDATDVAA